MKNKNYLIRDQKLIKIYGQENLCGGFIAYPNSLFENYTKIPLSNFELLLFLRTSMFFNKQHITFDELKLDMSHASWKRVKQNLKKKEFLKTESLYLKSDYGKIIGVGTKYDWTGLIERLKKLSIKVKKNQINSPGVSAQIDLPEDKNDLGKDQEPVDVIAQSSHNENQDEPIRNQNDLIKNQGEPDVNTFAPYSDQGELRRLPVEHPESQMCHTTTTKEFKLKEELKEYSINDCIEKDKVEKENKYITDGCKPSVHTLVNFYTSLLKQNGILYIPAKSEYIVFTNTCKKYLEQGLSYDAIKQCLQSWITDGIGAWCGYALKNFWFDVGKLQRKIHPGKSGQEKVQIGWLEKRVFEDSGRNFAKEFSEVVDRQKKELRHGM